MAKIWLSDAGRDKVSEMLDWFHSLPRNTTGRPSVEPPLPQSQHVYLVRAPAGGIPALTALGTGSGSADLTDDIVGSAECQIYRVNDEDPEELAVESLSDDDTVTVCNLSTTAIAAYAWVLAVRDKFGIWYAANSFGEIDVCALLLALPGYNASMVQVLGHDANGDCQWYDTDTCDGTGS